MQLDLAASVEKASDSVHDATFWTGILPRTALSARMAIFKRYDGQGPAGRPRLPGRDGER